MSSKKAPAPKGTQAPLQEPAHNPIGGSQAPLNPHLLSELQSEVSNEATPLLQFILNHAVIIMAGLALFVLILAGIGGYNWYAERNLQEAQANLSQIVLSNQGEERISALEAFLISAPSSMQGGIQLSLAETAMELKDYTKAAGYFGALAMLDTEGALGLLAALNQGQALLLAKKPKEALPIFESLVDKASAVQKIVIQQSLAEAAIQAGDVEKAKKTFEAMAAATPGAEGRFFRYRARTVGKDLNSNNTTKAPENDAKDQDKAQQ